MAQSNAPSKAPLNPDEIFSNVENARLSHSKYSENAVTAAAHAYLVWQDTQSSIATREGKSWFEGEIERKNKSIEADNKNLKDREKRVEAYKTDTLGEDDWIKQPGKTAAEKKEIADEIKLLDLQKSYDKKMWTNFRKIPYVAREGASPFLVLVKYIFQLDYQRQATIASRYAFVLEWIEDHFKGQQVEDIAEIITAVNAAGGFEEVLEDMRLKKGGESEDAEDRKICSEAILADTKAVLRTTEPKVKISMEARFARDGFVMMLGRYNGGSIDIVGEVDAAENDVNRLIARYEDPELLPVSDKTDFVSRILDLGSLIAEDDKSDSQPSNADRVNIQRMVCFRLDKDGNPQLVLSARGSDSSPVIYVHPKEHVGLGAPSTNLYMQAKFRRRLEKKISSYEKRRLIDMDFDDKPMQADGKTPADSPMSWVTLNSALRNKGRRSATEQFYWYDLAKTPHKPLDVENFRPQFEAVLGADDIHAIFDRTLKEWGRSMDSNKNSRTVKLVYKQDILSVSLKDEAGTDIELTQSSGDMCEMPFRPRDMHDLFAILVEQHGSQYTLKGDDGGLLEISWSDKMADYWVFLPTSSSDGRLQTRRVAPMRLSSPQMAAAE